MSRRSYSKSCKNVMMLIANLNLMQRIRLMRYLLQYLSINLLHQYLLRTVLLTLNLEQCKGDESESKEKAKQAHLSDHDMQVIHYIAGFVPFSLQKKKMKSEQGRNYTNLLKVWQVNKEDTIIAPSFLTYTVTWLHLQNRGGLFEVHDVFRFFFSMGKVSGNLLRKQNLRSMSSTNVSQTMLEQLQANNLLVTAPIMD